MTIPRPAHDGQGAFPAGPIRLGVNVDHVATLRQARGTRYPDPVQAALSAEQAGADGITIHLREDRRHIQERDVHLLKDTLTIPMNLEMAASPAMVAFALGLRPEHCCLVPERREELTTEGGLNVAGGLGRMTEVVGQLQAAGIVVSLFIDPHPRQIEAAHAVGAPVVELHTGAYADAQSEAARARELLAVVQGVEAADALGLTVHAGHGLHYHNVEIIAALPQLRELNIGHAIIARALFTGLPEAVREMKRLLREARL